MAEKILVALGGNALIRSGQRGTIEEQRDNLGTALAGLVELIHAGHQIAITHGNGPQIGNILIRTEAAQGQAYELSLDLCGAQSQGEMGYLIQQCLQNLLHRREIDRRVVTVISQVLVDRHDPRLKEATKPIGPFYSPEQAARLREQGYTLVEDAQRGYRRVVPSPRPLRVLEQEVIQQLFEQGVIVIAAGGGGIPVCVSEDGSLVGVEAVIDKDLTSSLLATALRADRWLNLTATEKVKLHFGMAHEKEIDTMSVSQAKHYLAEGHFTPGSMGPKIEAAIGFLERGGRAVIITLPEQARAALRGQTGTHILPG
jgi:carbamate kinase